MRIISTNHKKRLISYAVSLVLILSGLILMTGCADEYDDDFWDEDYEYDYSDDEDDYGDFGGYHSHGAEGEGEAVTQVSSAEYSSSAPYADESAITVDTNAATATVMIYVNGSDLETKAGEASGDIGEMIESGIGKNVNVIIQTMGTKEWQDYGISSKTSQTYKIENGKLKLIRDDLGQLDCTSAKTLSEFIGFCKSSYPADRYMLIFWDHGGGPVYGFGYDEWQTDENASLTLAEMTAAFSEHNDIRFDLIGMDCCIMASMETLYAFAPYCKYALLSEDFESGLGWSYARWMKHLEEHPGISTPLLGKYIVDDIVKTNEEEYGGDSACLGLFNVSTAKSLYTAWKTYAYKNEDALLNKNYSRPHMAKGRGFWDLWGFDESDVTLSDYYITDILALVENVDNDSDEAKSLMSALKAAVAYYGHTSDKNELTGLAVSLPYGDTYFYSQLKDVYTDIGFEKEYIDWLGQFVYSDGYEDYYDYGGFESSWGGWGAYENEYGCNISSGGSCEYGYDYDCDDYCYYNEGNEDDNWIYDYEEDLWYCYEDDILYLYDEESDTIFYYDEYTDEIYYYDEEQDDWFLAE